MSVIPERQRRRRAEVNLIPLIDVLVCLIFFFLVSMQFRGASTLNLVLPKIETAGENKLEQQIEIAIGPQGDFFYNGTPVTSSELEAALRTAASLGQNWPVLVLADENSVLKDVTFAMDACRKNGLENIRLQSR